MGTEGTDERKVQLLLALTDFGVWKSLRDHGVPDADLANFISALVQWAESTAS